MGSDEAKTAVNGVVDPAADATEPSEPAKGTEKQDISCTTRDEHSAAAETSATVHNGSVPAVQPASNGAVPAVRHAGPLARSAENSHAWHGDVAEHEQHQDDEDEDGEWADEYHDLALFASIFSAPSLALAGFVFALTGLLGGMIPESLPYLVQVDPTLGPAFHVRFVGLIALGFAIIAASLGLAAMLRSIGSPLRWPRYLGGAAVLLALLIALQAVLLIGIAGLSGTPGVG
jgi:hypothetical protein